MKSPRCSVLAPSHWEAKGAELLKISRKSAAFLVLAIALETMVLAESGTPRLWAGSAAQAASGSLAGYDVCIFEDSNAPDRGFKAGQQQWLARVNPVLAQDLPTVEKARKAGIPVIAGAGENQRPRLDVEASAWVAFAQRELFEPCLPRGFDGWVVDGLTNVPTATGASLLAALRQAHPTRRIVVKDGFDLGMEFGLLVEGSEAVLSEHEGQTRTAAQQGRQVLALGHATAPALAKALADRLSRWGAAAFVTTAEPTGVALAPLRELPRRVLVIYGRDPKETGKAKVLPIDSMTAELFQTPMEWLGYEADFLDVSRAALPGQVAVSHAAVLVDAETEVPMGLELDVALWLVQARKAGVPVLFTGGLPFEREDALEALREGFGLRGSLLSVPDVRDVAIASVDAKVMNTEAKAAPRVQEFKDLQAPEKSRIYLSLTGRGSLDQSLRYTPVFMADWGGMWLEPYIILRASQDSYPFYADPYQIMAEFLGGRGLIPAPDTTTRDGRRVFYSHIDGDGFISRSDFKGHPFCAELVRDRVLKAFPFPVTVSIIESDIRAWSKGVEDEAQPEIEALAKSIFELPNVAAASHSFSHPYQWDKDDPNPGIYTEPNIPLKPAANYPVITTEREVRGSVDYISRHLLPKDKRVEVFLWSGNCRPGEEALRLVREMGLENMNGGNTIVSRLYPGIAGIAPRVVQWGSELQINAANQNEFMYANGWNGPFYGGFADVVDTFERTESPRRIKPVNVYYHFYSATSLSALRALEKIYRWCEEQPLHPVTALQFAQMTKDAYRTRVYELGARHWLLANEGHLRSYRLPASAGRPVMDQCQGVTGWTEHAGSIYVHTNGQPRVELKLGDARPEPPAPAEAHLFLASSTAEIEFQQLAGWKAQFHTRSLRAVTVEFGGLPAGATCAVTINKVASQVSADAKGRLTLSLSPDAVVTLDADRSRYALLR